MAGRTLATVLASANGSVPPPYLIRISSVGTPSTFASATRASAPCRTKALDQLVWPGGR